MSLPAPRRAAAADAPVLIETLTDAFVDEPLLNWWLKQGEAKTAARRGFFEHAVNGGVHPKAEHWMLGAGEAAAIWTPPGVSAFELPPLRMMMVMPRLLRIAGFGGMRKAIAMGELLTSHHPSVPHAHLVFLGVRSDQQGRGCGSALLKAGLAEVDRAGLGAYLETATEANVRLYQRHGFEVAAELQLQPDGPMFWTMWRAPRVDARA